MLENLHLESKIVITLTADLNKRQNGHRFTKHRLKIILGSGKVFLAAVRVSNDLGR